HVALSPRRRVVKSVLVLRYKVAYTGDAAAFAVSWPARPSLHQKSREAEDVPGGRRVESGAAAGGGRRVVSAGVVGAPGVVDDGVVTIPPGGHHQCVAHQRCCTTGNWFAPVGAALFPGATAIGCGGRRGGNSAAESAGTRTRTRCDGHHQCGAHHSYCLCKNAYCARSGVRALTVGSRNRSGVPTLSAASTSESAGVKRDDRIA